jgi:hypothetical protein
MDAQGGGHNQRLAGNGRRMVFRHHVATPTTLDGQRDAELGRHDAPVAVDTAGIMCPQIVVWNTLAICATLG